MNISVLCITYRDKLLVTNLIKSFEKFKPSHVNLQYVIVENTMDDSNKNHVEALANDVTYINVPFGEKYNIINGNSSLGHGMAYNEGKRHIKYDLTFICHSDCMVTSTTFFNDFETKVKEGYSLIGVSKDAHPNRIEAIHCSGYLVETDILRNTSMLPNLPKIDTTDYVTVYCRDNNKKIFCFDNTYNEKLLTHNINEPYKSLGPDCGVDRCIGSNNHEVIYIHQGRGTTKLMKKYFKPGKIDTEAWLVICKYILEKKEI